MAVDSGDVFLIHTDDGGDITLSDGCILMTNGFETAVYLSLFGGNIDDDGTSGNDLSWWGNTTEKESDCMLKSQLQNILAQLLPSSSALNSVDNAIKNDLAWMNKYVTELEIETRIVGRNVLSIVIWFFFNGSQETLSYTANWGL